MSLRIRQTRDFEPCRRLRLAVFVWEQGIPLSEEFDSVDDTARHLLVDLDGAPLGTARIFAMDGTGWIGRICVLPAGRGLGIGAALVRYGTKLLRREPRVRDIALGAQLHAIPFYEKLGFAISGPLYDDAGIPHREMRQPA
jgi:ElaA protein